MDRFHLIDQYLGSIQDIDVAHLEPGEYAVVETSRRLRCEQSYSFVHALLGLIFSDGRIAFSVMPGVASEVISLLGQQSLNIKQPFEQDWVDNLANCVRQARVQAGLSPSREVSESLCFACDKTLVRRWYQGDCRRLTDERIPPIAGLFLPTHCFPDGIVYGVIQDNHIVSVAYAHKTKIMEDQVADLGVETAASYRKQGYAKTAVSAVTSHMTSLGGEAIYMCNKDNQASIATASSVGYELYARKIVISASGN